MTTDSVVFRPSDESSRYISGSVALAKNALKERSLCDDCDTDTYTRSIKYVYNGDAAPWSLLLVCGECE